MGAVVSAVKSAFGFGGTPYPSFEPSGSYYPSSSYYPQVHYDYRDNNYTQRTNWETPDDQKSQRPYGTPDDQKIQRPYDQKRQTFEKIRKLEFKKQLDPYFPSGKTEALCKVKDLSEEHIKQHYDFMRMYLANNQSLNASNMVDVFTLLLEIEDINICKKYYCLNRNHERISKLSKDYSVEVDLMINANEEEILKEGDDIVLSRNARTYYGTVTKISGNSVYFYLRDQAVPLMGFFDIMFKPNRLQIRIQREALQIFPKKLFLAKMLFPTVNIMQESSRKRLSLYNQSIATIPEQEEAVMNIVGGPINNIPYIIFGPPGTGKTTTVVECILQVMNQSVLNKILVVAGSNSACDEISLRLLKKLDPCGKNVLRLYSAAFEKRSKSLDYNLRKASNLSDGSHFYPPLETICSYRIIVCTLSVSGKLYQGDINENFFSHIFIDECAASTETEALVPICCIMSPKCKLILSGDSKQLGPILKNNLVSDLGMKTSLLERLLGMPCYQKDVRTQKHNRTILTRLVRNFRNHPDILKISNKLYYDNELIPCAKKDLTHWAVGWQLLPQKNVPIIFHAVQGRSQKEGKSTSMCNYAEINVVMKYVNELMLFGVNGRIIQQHDIGIVTPYKKQFNLIKGELDKKEWSNIETGAVETFQGKEKPIIILSTVRSNTTTIGFLDNPKRLNVSLTRAQALLIIIGNPHTLSMNADWSYVVNYCKEKGVFRGNKSLFTTRVASNKKSLNTYDSNIPDLTNLSIDDRSKSRTKNRTEQVKCKNTPNEKTLSQPNNTNDENCMGFAKYNDKFKAPQQHKFNAPNSTHSKLSTIGLSNKECYKVPPFIKPTLHNS